MRQEALEQHVLKKLSDLVFQDGAIPQIVSSYNQYLSERNADDVEDSKVLRQSINRVSKEMANITNAIAQTGLLTLTDKLAQLEREKTDLESQLFLLDDHMSAQRVTRSEIEGAFRLARDMLKRKDLPTTQKLVDAFVDKVTVYHDHVEVRFNIGLDEGFLDREKHGAAGQSNHHAILPTPTEKSVDIDYRGDRI